MQVAQLVLHDRYNVDETKNVYITNGADKLEQWRYKKLEQELWKQTT